MKIKEKPTKNSKNVPDIIILFLAPFHYIPYLPSPVRTTRSFSSSLHVSPQFLIALAPSASVWLRDSPPSRHFVRHSRFRTRFRWSRHSAPLPPPPPPPPPVPAPAWVSPQLAPLIHLMV
ncbi:hypothetical protein BC938DRAFT_475547 [Jimgerdemannia flammicorona]|uniref:Uncharacterized protein n=1 Tax=Jimgerdemannia flammicorona TaxID=994334 RepID=A0A433QRG4_9FUNG|nr:hypothetical protein BC938DRAFT_475547 [Jimgerdemannia flammicorona]